MGCHANSSDLQPCYGEIMSGLWIRYMSPKERGDQTLTCKATGLQTVHKTPFWPLHLLQLQGQPQAGAAFPAAASLLPSWLRAAALPRRGPDGWGGIIPTLTPVILSALTFRLSSASTACLHFPLTASDCCLAAWPYANTIQTDSPPQLHHCLLLIQEIDSHMKLSLCSTFITGWHILSDSQLHPGES